MNPKETDIHLAAQQYDRKAAEYNWRGPGEEPEYTAGPQSTRSCAIVTMYRRNADEVNCLLENNRFELLRSVEFFAYMDTEKSIPLRLKAYVGRRIRRD